MSSPVICLRTLESIRRIAHIMECDNLSHNGFPVVDCDENDQVSSFYRTRFLIQLCWINLYIYKMIYDY